MTHFTKWLMVAALSMPVLQNMFAAAGRDVATNTFSCCVGNCTGNISCQTGSANAAGDTRDIDVKGLNFMSLGTISATKFVKLAVPTASTRVGYSISFAAAGNLANQSIKFLGLFETEGGKAIYKFYRQLPNERFWVEVGSLHAATTISEMEPVITPDGAIISINDGQIGIMFVATQALNVPRAAKSSR